MVLTVAGAILTLVTTHEHAAAAVTRSSSCRRSAHRRDSSCRLGAATTTCCLRAAPAVRRIAIVQWLAGDRARTRAAGRCWSGFMPRSMLATIPLLQSGTVMAFLMASTIPWARQRGAAAVLRGDRLAAAGLPRQRRRCDLARHRARRGLSGRVRRRHVSLGRDAAIAAVLLSGAEHGGRAGVGSRRRHPARGGTVTMALSVRDLALRYGRRLVCRQRVLRSRRRASALGVLGSNGAGKTTLLRAIDWLSARRLSVRFGSKDCRRAMRCDVTGVAYFAGEATLAGLRPRLAMGQRSAPATWSRPTGGRCARSRGERGSWSGLRTALGRHPLGLVVLDEPWEGLDADASRWLHVDAGDEAGSRRRGGGVIAPSWTMLPGCAMPI